MAKILIYETCQERANGLYRQVQWHYNTATDAVESQINSGVNSCSAYAYSTTNPLHFFCVEGTTTRKTVFHAGNGTVRYEETLNSPDCGYNPPGGNPKPEDCNLVVTSAEASPSRKGANNGLVVIEVTGGTLPMEYSIDGVNFGTNNYIGNLAPGNYFAYARKGNQVACIANKAFMVAELPGITIEVSSGCEGGLGFIDLNVSSPESETFFIDLLNQTTQENIHEEITATTSYSFLYTNLSNGDWVVKVKGSLNTFEVLSEVQNLQCAPGTGNGQGGKRISEMEELLVVNPQTYFAVIDLTETDTSKQNKKLNSANLPAGNAPGGNPGENTTQVLDIVTLPYTEGATSYNLPAEKGITLANIKLILSLGGGPWGYIVDDYSGLSITNNILTGLPEPAPGTTNWVIHFYRSVAVSGGSGSTNPYNLPIASTSTLGGFRLGAGLTINPTTGVLSVTAQAGSGIPYYNPATPYQFGVEPTLVKHVVDGKLRVWTLKDTANTQASETRTAPSYAVNSQWVDVGYDVVETTASALPFIKERVNSLPHTTLQPTTRDYIVMFTWDGIVQDFPSLDNTADAPDYIITNGGAGTKIISAVGAYDNTKKGQIVYQRKENTETGTPLEPQPAAPGLSINDQLNIATITAVSGFPNPSDYEYELILS